MRSRLLLALFLAACTRTETVTRFVTLHQTASCEVPSGSFGKYVATGDFEPLAENLAQQPLAIDAAGLTIDGVPGNVKSLAVLATPWLGAALVPDTGDVDLLLLPQASACALNGNGVGFVSQMVFAAVSSKTFIASGPPDSNNLHPSYRIDLGTGRVARMSNGMGKPRTNAAVAVLGDGRALVIGGLVSTSITEPSIEIFDEATGDFDSKTFNLQTARSDHGATALIDGDVFVAGGQNVQGIVTETELLHFDGTEWRSTLGSTPPLSDPRKSPYVLRLADGTVLVGGGFDKNGPASTIEFLSANAGAEIDPTTVLSPNGNNAFVALDGGGALLVDADAAKHAWFVAPKQIAIPIDPDITAPITKPMLFPHAGGGALIWTGSAWWTFDPWSGCAPLANAPTTGPGASSPIAFGEPGMRAWVNPDPEGSVSVWRDSIRNEFATEGPYLVSDTSLMSPDALPTPTFANGALSLSSTQSAFVSDARYLDVSVQVDGAHVVIRASSGEVDVGRDCAGPIQPSETLYVERHGAFVTFAQNGGPLIPCAAIDPSARVAVGVRGNGAARNLVVKRLGTALP